MRKVLTFLTFLFTVLGLHAESKFYFAEQKIKPGETKQVELNLLNEAVCEGFQLKITLPAGLSFVEDEEEEDYIVKTSRTPKKFNVVTELKAAGELNLVGYFSSGTSTIAAGDGAILHVLVKAAEDASLGTGKITISNAQINLEGNVNVNPATTEFDFDIYGQVTVTPVSADETQGTVSGGGVDLDSADPVTVKAVPATGYKFVGWYDGETQVSTDAEYTFKPSKTITLTAKFEILKFTIKFFQEDGTTQIGESLVLDYNAAITAPTAPTKEGYKFAGWDPTVPATALADGSYKATFTINKYKVKFVKDDGTTVVKEEELEYGKAITAPTAPEKEGYTFKAWDPVVDATVPAKDVTYKATYTVNQYTVKFLHPKDNSEILSEVLDYGAAITAPTTVAEWYKGWALESDLATQVEVAATVPANDLTYVAFFETTMYKITYKVEGQEDIVKQVGFEYALPEDPTPEVEGYTFDSWTWKDAAGTDLAKPTTMPDKDLVATATLFIKTNTVKFFEEDGTTQIGSDFTGEYNSAITAPTAADKTGWSFVGWTVVGGDGTVLEDVTKIPGDNTGYKAVYEINKYYVTWKVDGEVLHVDTLEYGATIVAFDAQKEGYTFKGWEDYPTTVPADNVDVTGTFTINQYTVAFVTLKEDGSVDKTIKTDTQDYATDIVAPDATDATVAAELEKDGWIFMGWALDANPDSVVTVAATVPANDLTYVAYYVPNIVYVHYVVEGDTIVSKEVEYKAALPTDTIPGQEGYTFSGWTWKLADGTALTEKPDAMPAQDVVAEGSFIINQYVITFIADGVVVKTDTLDYATDIVAPEAPEKRGHDFVGWDGLLATVPAYDAYFYAYYEARTYNVTYKVDGEEYAVVALLYGDNITAPAPEKEGYTFSGWEGLPEQMPARNVTATGSFIINQYNVTFMDGETVVKTEALDFGAEIVAPEAPAKDGYEFVGWKGLVETVPAYDVTFDALYAEIGEVDIDPIEEKTEVTFADELKGDDGEVVSLTNVVVNQTYYNFDPTANDGYDATEECLVLNTTTSDTQMNEVVATELGSTEMAAAFSGIIFAVNGEGKIEIDCQTFGLTSLAVKIGTELATAFKQNDRGVTEVAYNVTVDTYVYIYATLNAPAAAQQRRAVAAGTDALKIWSINIVPGEEFPVGVSAIREAIEQGGCYTIDGRKLNDVPKQKGIYIINGKKVMLR